MTLPTDGPYLAAALWCERALLEKDDVFSFIRVVDRFTAQGPAPTFRLEGDEDVAVTEAVPIALTAALIFKAGSFRGQPTLRLVMTRPNGATSEPFQSPMDFSDVPSDDGGHHLSIEIRILMDPGLYWFDIYLDDDWHTRMPLRVIRQEPDTSEPAE